MRVEQRVALRWHVAERRGRTRRSRGDPPASSGDRGVAAPPRRAAALLLLLVATPACERERRDYREALPGAAADRGVQTTELQAGPILSDPTYGPYQENRWAVAQGQMLYLQFNCAGCHSPGGGGGMGPPLIDGEWIYGSDPENVFDTIVEGRPNGMPSFRGKITNSQIWQLVAYVRAMGGLTPPDTWPGRGEHMQEATPIWGAPAERLPR